MARRFLLAREQASLLAPWRAAAVWPPPRWNQKPTPPDEELETEFDDVEEPHLQMPISAVDHYVAAPEMRDIPAEDSWFPGLARHIAVYGIRRPLEIATDGALGILNDGHHRLAEAQRQGMSHVPVRVSVKPPGYFGHLVGRGQLRGRDDDDDIVHPVEPVLKDYLYRQGLGYRSRAARRVRGWTLWF